MTLREFYLERRRAEAPVFLNVLRAVPADHLSYKPHDRSPTAEQVVWTVTSELRACLDAATHYKAEWKAEPPRSLREMVHLFERWSNELTDVVAKMDEASWNRVWFILFNAIHHRGQLSAYLRPMGGTVPGIHGPSADSRSM